MSAFKDLTGQRFGKLTALSGETYRDKQNKSRSRWLCSCDCGGTRVVQSYKLKEGRVTHCGCKKRIARHGHATGGVRTTEYNIWTALRQRCHNPNVSHYQYYGAKGVKVCPSWDQSFANFLADMGPRPSKGHSIDRINPNGNYEPGNCRWATASEQALNRRSNTKYAQRRIES